MLSFANILALRKLNNKALAVKKLATDTDPGKTYKQGERDGTNSDAFGN